VEMIAETDAGNGTPITKDVVNDAPVIMPVQQRINLEDLLFSDDGTLPHLDRLDRNDYDIPAFLRRMQD